MPRVSTLITDDNNIQRWSGQVSQAVKVLQDARIVRGVFIEDVELVQATNTYINHGLPYYARGWIVVDTDKAIAGLYRVKSAESSDQHIVLYATTITSGPATVSLWVF